MAAKITNFFGIFNFDAELEWCKFRALTVAHCILIYPVSSHMLHMLPTSHTQDHAKAIRKEGGHLGNNHVCAESAIFQS